MSKCVFCRKEQKNFRLICEDCMRKDLERRNQPKRSKREEAIVFDLDENTKGVINSPNFEIKIKSPCGALNTAETP